MPQPHRHSVLVVDDDPLILASFRRITRDLPARMRFASTIEEAWNLVLAEVPAVIISDYRLPDGDGLSFLEKVHARFPAVKRILHTGEAVMRVDLGVGADVPVLGKPCPPETLEELMVTILNDLGRTKPV